MAASTIPRRPDLTFTLAPVRMADARVVVAAAVASAGFDLAVRSGVACLAAAFLVAFVSGAMLGSGRLANPQAKAMALAAPVFGTWLAIRASPWLIPLDILAAGGLLVLAASFARSGSLFDLSVPRALARSVHAAVHGAMGLPFMAGPARPLRRRSSRRRELAVIRGLLLAAPILVLLGFLLASADAVFANFFRIDVSVDPVAVAGHLGALLLGLWGMAGLLRVASAAELPSLPPSTWRLGAVESVVVLGTMCALFGAFAAAQLVALSEGERHVLERAGLTYAEYARTGFFQLLAVAAITLAVLMTMRAVADRSSPAVRRGLDALTGTAVALTLVIVMGSVKRLDLYERAYGLTMLRLFSKTFAIWIGVVFVLFALSVAGLWRHRHWFLPAAAGAGLATLLVLNAVNPEAVVVRHNVAHARAGGRFDPGYLAELSDDAVPALVEAVPHLDTDAQGMVRAELCRQPLRPWHGWAASNLSHVGADERRQALCAF